MIEIDLLCVVRYTDANSHKNYLPYFLLLLLSLFIFHLTDMQWQSVWNEAKSEIRARTELDEKIRGNANTTQTQWEREGEKEKSTFG